MGGRKPARMRCGECEFCLREDCGQCIQCVQKKKFGGTGTSKQACMHRRCINLQDRPAKSSAVVASTGAAASNMARSSSSSARAASSHTKIWSTSSSNANMSVAASATTSRDNHNSSNSMTATVSPLLPLLPVMACPVSSHAKAPPGTATTSATASTTTTTTITAPTSTAAAVLKVLAKTTTHLPTMTHMYGRAIPVLEKKDVCAGCGGARDEEAELEPILLCDGKGCGCEFHLKCCIPPLRKVPEGSFYCYDCSEEGSTTLLRQYFEEHDERRLEYPDPQSFLEALWAQDFEKDADDEDEEFDEQENDGEGEGDDKAQADDENDDKAATKSKSSSSYRKKGSTSTPSASTTTASKSKKRKRKPNLRLPASELAQAIAFHASALSPMPRMKQHQLDHLIPATSPQDRIAVEDTAHENDDATNIETSSRNNIVLTPTRRLLIGKPVKLFCSFADGYHTGRIVSVRRGTLWTSPRNRQSETQGTAATAAASTDDEEDESTDEYLIRFQAGLEGRKTALHWWVCLEEHSLAVATTLVWCDFGNKNGYKGFKPGRLWLRTSRELIPLRHVLREEQGHVVYIEPSNKSSKTTSTSASRRSSSSTTAATNKKIAKLSLTQYIGEFGDEGFKLLHLQTEATDLFSPVLAALVAPLLPSSQPQASTPPPASKPSKSSRSSRGSSKATAAEGTSPAGAAAAATTASATDATPTWIRVRELEYAQACAEWEEQQRVFEWFHRPVENPAFEKALSCLDEPSLGPLYLLPAGSNSSSGKGDDSTNTKNKGGMIAMTMDLNRYHADLAPSIPRGLDRNYVMKLLERSCHVTGSKDVAASLSCETVVSIPAALQAMRDERRERHSANLKEVAT